MKQIWKNLSATYKILITMLLFVMLIQLTTLLYIWKVESKVLLEKERQNLIYQLNINAKLLLNHMHSLHKELEFLATLEVMDDIVVHDIDKRITTLLQKKSKDLKEGIILVAKDNNQTLIASSQPSYYTLKDFFIFSVPVYASFDSKKRLGSLQLLYPLKNFKTLKIDNPHQMLWIENENVKHNLEKEKKIVVSQKLEGYLKGKNLFLAYEKAYALQSLQEIEKILLFAFLLSLCSLLFVVWLLSKKQMKLLEHTQEILELKRTFLSTMSHELRTPLGSILTLTQQLMINPTINDDDIESLRGIERASSHLLSMINNLLQLSKLESNVMLVKKEKVEVKALIEEMLELVEPLIDEKNLLLNKRFEVNKLEIITDLNLFRQVVMNLFSNAIKFTEKGNITIRLHREENNYVLTVIDTGIGIEKEKQLSLFSEFYQAHNESHNIKHSTGLGLALSQKVAKLINGKIEIESRGKEQGVKATFRFTSL
jgi:signal transduction histidine kinase